MYSPSSSLFGCSFQAAISATSKISNSAIENFSNIHQAPLNSLTGIKNAKRLFKRPKICHICQKSFKRTEHLNRHLLCHSKSKPYHCTVCQKAFSRIDALKRHARTHNIPIDIPVLPLSPPRSEDSFQEPDADTLLEGLPDTSSLKSATLDDAMYDVDTIATAYDLLALSYNIII